MSTDPSPTGRFHMPVVYDDDFTKTEITRVIRDGLKGLRLNCPTQDDIAFLVYQLNTCRLFQKWKRSSSLRHLLGRNRSIKLASQNYVKLLTALRSDLNEANRQFSGVLSEEIGSAEKDLLELESAILAFLSRTNILAHDPPWAEPAVWTEVAPVFASLFRQAVALANPSKEILGNGPRGPVGKFLAFVIPRLTDETVQASTIAKYLARSARETGSLLPLAVAARVKALQDKVRAEAEAPINRPGFDWGGW